MPDCIFDRLRDGDIAGHVVLDEPDVLGFLDHRPLFPGHTLVVPRRHVATLADLDAATADAVWDAGRRLAAAMRPALAAEGAFLALNDEVSQSVAHVHLHVVPRRRKDGLKGFFWPRQRYDSEEHAAAVAAALTAALAAAAGRSTLRATVTGSSVAVRDAVPGDLPTLVGLLKAGSLTTKEDSTHLGPYSDALASVIADPMSTVLVAEVAAEVVGMCELMFLRHLQQRGGLCGEIESMHVAPAHRSSGIGAVLLEAAVERAAAAGCYRVQLTSNTARPDAHRFYERHGFAPSHVGFKRYLDATPHEVPDSGMVP